jgi:hypothetical protein
MGTAEGVTRARLDVDPRLARRVVDLTVEKARSSGDGSPARALSAALEPVYRASAGEAARAEGFEAIDRRLFEEWGGASVVAEAVAELPRLAAALDAIWLGCAERGEAAGADLGGKTLRQLGVAVSPSLFLEPEALRLFLRRELLHVDDTLDPEFGYRPGILLAGRPGALENLARDRLRLLWGISVDGRVARRWPAAARLREERLGEARAAYRSLPEELPERVVERLWSGPRPAFEELRRWACGNESLLEAFLPGSRPAPGAFVPGSPCPLCGFPVARLVAEWGEERPHLEELIAIDFPAWRPESGACERCVEGYLVRAGAWL